MRVILTAAKRRTNAPLVENFRVRPGRHGLPGSRVYSAGRVDMIVGSRNGATCAGNGASYAGDGATDAWNGAVHARNGASDARNGVRDARNGVTDARNGATDARNGATGARNGATGARNGVTGARNDATGARNNATSPRKDATGSPWRASLRIGRFSDHISFAKMRIQMPALQPRPPLNWECVWRTTEGCI